MHSDKDLSERPHGQLCACLHPGGVPLADGTWVEEGSLVQLNAAVYGRVNAPSAWRKTIVRGSESLGYRRSCYDPCIFYLMDESGPQGHILIEVDDLARLSTSASGRASTTVRVTTPLERSFRINLTVSMSSRPSLFKRDCPLLCSQEDVEQTRNPEPLVVKRGNCVQCGARSIQRETRPDVSALASLTVPCKTCVTRMWQLSERKPKLSLEASFHTFLFTKCVGLPFRTLPGLTPPRITVKELSWLVQVHQDCGTTSQLC